MFHGAVSETFLRRVAPQHSMYNFWMGFVAFPLTIAALRWIVIPLVWGLYIAVVMLAMVKPKDLKDQYQKWWLYPLIWPIMFFDLWLRAFLEKFESLSNDYTFL